MKETIALYAHKDINMYSDNIIKLHPKSNPYNILIKRLKEVGFEVHTLDIYNKQGVVPKYCLFFDIPKISISKIVNTSKTIKIVLLREADVILKRNYNKSYHSQFDKILTWKTSIVDNKRYFYFPSAKVNLSKKVNVKNPLKRKFCCLINSNIKSNKTGELYSERLRIIKWFEVFQKNFFDLYGFGWDKKCFLILSRNFYIPFFLKKKRVSYKGSVSNKIETQSMYKFSICFQNTSIINNYLDEKIFDSFLANTVPVYWGCPNINELIPSNTFIDYRKFKSIEDLFNYMHNMSNDEYINYISNINKFLESEQIQKFSIDNWLDSIIKIFKEKK